MGEDTRDTEMTLPEKTCETCVWWEDWVTGQFCWRRHVEFMIAAEPWETCGLWEGKRNAEHIDIRRQGG